MFNFNDVDYSGSTSYKSHLTGDLVPDGNDGYNLQFNKKVLDQRWLQNLAGRVINVGDVDYSGSTHYESKLTGNLVPDGKDGYNLEFNKKELDQRWLMNLLDDVHQVNEHGDNIHVTERHIPQVKLIGEGTVMDFGTHLLII